QPPGHHSRTRTDRQYEAAAIAKTSAGKWIYYRKIKTRSICHTPHLTRAQHGVVFGGVRASLAVKIPPAKGETPLDTQSIIAELEAERDRLDRAIAALQSSQTGRGWRATKGRA